VNNIKNRKIFESEDTAEQPDNEEVGYFSFMPFFEDDLTYTMSPGRKQAFIRCAKWLFQCVGITDQEYLDQVKLDTPDREE
jgi:hypothetical protein